MNIAMWQEKVHKLALEKGWWTPLEEDPKNMTLDILVSKLMLMVSELAEACEEVRNNKFALYFESAIPNIKFTNFYSPDDNIEHAVRLASEGHKPEGIAVELADCVIRIMDLCEFMSWNLEHAIWVKHEYNKSRAIRHGGKVL